MKKNLIRSLFALACLAPAAHAQIQITEVDAAGSTATTGYAADWFELKNVGGTAVNLTGWKMDDSSSNYVSASVALRGVTSIAPGQSVVFLEGTATGTTDGSIDAAFALAWFGANAPAGLTLGNYGGSGVGLSTSSDAVNIFDSAGNVVAYVSFGASTLGNTFDNSTGANGVISVFSSVGVNGAFLSANGVEVGSPDGLAPVPEPTTLALGGLGMGAMMIFRRRQKA